MDEQWKNALRKSWTPERKAQQAEIMRKRMQDPAVRDKVRESARKRMANPEVREKIAASLRKRYSDINELLRLQTKLQEYWTPEQRRKHRELVIAALAGKAKANGGERDYTRLREVMSSSEYKARMSEAQKLAWAKFRASGKVRVRSEESRRLMSEKAKARMADPAYRANLSANLTWRTIPLETRKKMSASAKQRAQDLTERLRRHDIMKARMSIKANRDRMRASQIEQMTNPENRAKISKAQKGYAKGKARNSLMKRLIAERGHVEMYLSDRLSMKFNSTREAALWIMDHSAIKGFLKVEGIIRKECRMEAGEQCFGYFWRYI